MIVWLILKNRRADKIMRTYELCLECFKKIWDDGEVLHRHNWLLSGVDITIDKPTLDLMRIYANLGRFYRLKLLDHSLIKQMHGKVLDIMQKNTVIRGEIDARDGGLSNREYHDLMHLLNSMRVDI